MFHALYIIAFAVLAVLTVGNLIRNLMLLGSEARRQGQRRNTFTNNRRDPNQPVPHPEMLDDSGQITDEPLLVMRSISLEDAREKLDSLYNDNGGKSDEGSEDAER